MCSSADLHMTIRELQGMLGFSTFQPPFRSPDDHQTHLPLIAHLLVERPCGMITKGDKPCVTVLTSIVPALQSHRYGFSLSISFLPLSSPPADVTSKLITNLPTGGQHPVPVPYRDI